MDNILPAIVLIAIIMGAWYLLRPPVVFVIRYRGGKPRVVRGRLTESALRAIDDICQQSGVQLGSITALPMGKRQIRLKFTGNIPPGCQQQLRNMALAGSMNDIRLSPPR
jgi:hypothetical protein